MTDARVVQSMPVKSLTKVQVLAPIRQWFGYLSICLWKLEPPISQWLRAAIQWALGLLRQEPEANPLALTPTGQCPHQNPEPSTLPEHLFT